MDFGNGQSVTLGEWTIENSVLKASLSRRRVLRKCICDCTFTVCQASNVDRRDVSITSNFSPSSVCHLVCDRLLVQPVTIITGMFSYEIQVLTTTFQTLLWVPPYRVVSKWRVTKRPMIAIVWEKERVYVLSARKTPYQWKKERTLCPPMPVSSRS